MRAVRILGRGVPAVVVVAVFLAASPAHATTAFPRFTAPVVDDAHVVPDATERQIDNELLDYQRRTGNQIAVAVVATTGGQSIDSYALALAKAWGVGQRGENNGVVIVVAYNDHKLRIEVGRGLESELTNAQASEIISDVMAPRLRDRDVGGAIEAATASVRSALGDAAAPQVAPPVISDPPRHETFGSSSSKTLALFFVFGFGVVLLVGAFGANSLRRRGWSSPTYVGSHHGFWGSSWSNNDWNNSGTSSSFDSGSSYDSGSSGGGFSGGGGGDFGGGGASGSW